MSSVRLPPEVLALIVERASGGKQSAMVPLCLVSRAWHEASIPLLYRRVELWFRYVDRQLDHRGSWRRLSNLCKDNLKTGKLGFVHEICFRSSEFWEELNPNQLRLLEKLVTACVDARKLEVQFVGRETAEAIATVVARAPAALLDITVIEFGENWGIHPIPPLPSRPWLIKHGYGVYEGLIPNLLRWAPSLIGLNLWIWTPNPTETSLSEVGGAAPLVKVLTIAEAWSVFAWIVKLCPAALHSFDLDRLALSHPTQKDILAIGQLTNLPRTFELGFGADGSDRNLRLFADLSRPLPSVKLRFPCLLEPKYQSDLLAVLRAGKFLEVSIDLKPEEHAKLIPEVRATLVGPASGRGRFRWKLGMPVADVVEDAK